MSYKKTYKIGMEYLRNVWHVLANFTAASFERKEKSLLSDFTKIQNITQSAKCVRHLTEIHHK